MNKSLFESQKIFRKEPIFDSKPLFISVFNYSDAELSGHSLETTTLHKVKLLNNLPNKSGLPTDEGDWWSQDKQSLPFVQRYLYDLKQELSETTDPIQTKILEGKIKMMQEDIDRYTVLLDETKEVFFKNFSLVKWPDNWPYFFFNDTTLVFRKGIELKKDYTTYEYGRFRWIRQKSEEVWVKELKKTS